MGQALVGDERVHPQTSYGSMAEKIHSVVKAGGAPAIWAFQTEQGSSGAHSRRFFKCSEEKNPIFSINNYYGHSSHHEITEMGDLHYTWEKENNDGNTDASYI